MIVKQHLILITLCVLICVGGVSGQEICDNGIDDDGDGLVDLRDTSECFCTIAANIESILPNPSFEEFSPDEEGCFSSQAGGLPDGPGQVDCLAGWIRASDGTTDSWNAFTYSGNPPSFPIRVPQPIPSGSGVAGFWSGILTPEDYDEFGNQIAYYREYLGACLKDGGGLEVGTAYRMNLQIGYTEETFFSTGEEPVLPLDSGRVSSPPLAPLAIYGIRKCEDVRFSTNECVENAPDAIGWEKITDFNVVGTPGSWTPTTVDFTPSFAYQALAIGANCDPNIVENRLEWRHYYFVDDIRINTVEAFTDPTFVPGPVSVSGESVCDDNIVLTGSEAPSASFQWFKDGVAIVGATERSFRVMPGTNVDGSYRLRTSTGGGCSLSEGVTIQRPTIPASVVRDSFTLCSEWSGRYIYGASNFAADFLWDDGSTGRNLLVTEPGDYSVTVSTACATQVEQYTVVLDAVPDFTVEVEGQICFEPNDEITLRVVSDWEMGSVDIINVYPDGTEVELGTIRNAPIRIDSIASPLLRFEARFFCGDVAPTYELDLSAEEPSFNAEITNLSCLNTSGGIALEPNFTDSATYAWLGSDGSPLPGENSLTLEVTTPGDYTLRITSADGCESDAVYTVTTVDENVNLSADIPTLSCANPHDTLVISSDVGFPLTYRWFLPTGEAIPGATEARLPVSEPGQYRVDISYGTSCVESTTFTIPFGDASLSFDAGNAVTNCASPSTDLIVTTSYTGALTFQWVGPDGVDIPGATNSTLPNAVEGMYLLRYSFASGCTRSVPFTIDFVDDFEAEIAVASSFCEDSHTLAAVTALGSAPFTYAWSDSTGNVVSTADSLGSAPSGSYALAVSDASGCRDTVGVSLNVVTSVRIDSISPVTDCETDGGLLATTASGGTEPYQYGLSGSTSTLDSDVFVPGGGTYTVTVTDANGCVVTSDPVVLTRPLEFDLEAGPDRLIELGDPIELRALFSPAVNLIPGLQMTWLTSGDTVSCASCPNTNTLPTRTATYVLSASSDEGCRATDSLLVTVNLSAPVYFPTAFSPNADGVNDYYHPFPGKAFLGVAFLKIYNRWGGMVYESTPDSPGWDGQLNGEPADGGVYSYISGLRRLDGELVEFSGTMTLVR